MLSKLLALGFIVLVLGRLFFRPQLRALGRWLDRLLNSMLIAIGLVYLLQFLIWFGGR